MEEKNRYVVSDLDALIKRGKGILDPIYHNEWEIDAESSFNGIYKGRDVSTALDVIEMLNNGMPVSQVSEKLRSFGLPSDELNSVLIYVTTYDKRGMELYFIEKGVPEMRPKYNFEETVQALINYRKMNKIVYCVFNDDVLTSEGITEDKAYRQVYGCSKEDYLKRRAAEEKRARMEAVREEIKALSNIPHWIEEGKKYIYPERYDDWEECVLNCAKGTYQGYDLNLAITIMEMLNNGASLEDAFEYYKLKDEEGEPVLMARLIIYNFAKQGPDFYEISTIHPLKPEEIANIEEKRQENSRFEENLRRSK